MLLCARCTREMNAARPIRTDPPEGVDTMASCADHDGVARALLAAFKFRHLTGLAALIAGFMADTLGPWRGAGPLVVPVPPASLRTWWRGFDPVAMLASRVADLAGLEEPESPVLRRRGSRRQRGRGRRGRLTDPPDIRPTEDAPRVLGGRAVLLVDDVMTTGATLSAGAASLRRAGSREVHALTFTRRL